MSKYEYFMVDADIVKTVIDSNRGDYIKIAIGIFYETKKYPNIQVGIDVKNITINDRVVGYEIKTNKNCNLIASDLFYHITQLINDPTIENVTINDTNMFEIIKDKENLTDDIKEVVNNYDPQVLVSQQSTQLPSFIPIQKSSQQTAHREAKQQNDQSLQAPFVGQVCELMKQYGTNLPIREHKGLANVINSCYLNTGMQCLNACPEFVAWVSSLRDSRNEYDKTFVSNVIYIIEIMRGDSDTNKFINTVRYIQYNLGLTLDEQDCSANFINLLINKLETIHNPNPLQSKSIEVSSIISNIVTTIDEIRNDLISELHMEGIVENVLKSQNLKLSWIIMFNINDPKTTTTNPIKLSEIIRNNIESLELKIEKHTYNYELVSMSMHSGSGNAGHYVAYAKHNDKWWYFSDDTVVHTIDELKSINDYFNPTVLFYRLNYNCPPLTSNIEV